MGKEAHDLLLCTSACVLNQSLNRILLQPRRHAHTHIGMGAELTGWPKLTLTKTVLKHAVQLSLLWFAVEILQVCRLPEIWTPVFWRPSSGPNVSKPSILGPDEAPPSFSKPLIYPCRPRRLWPQPCPRHKIPECALQDEDQRKPLRSKLLSKGFKGMVKEFIVLNLGESGEVRRISGISIPCTYVLCNAGKRSGTFDRS